MTTRNTTNRIRLYGRIFLEMDIRAVTGLRIGGSPAALSIGNLDNPVIRNPMTNQPYIPGSSLRGKMRSLWEKVNESEQNFSVRQNEVYIHAYPDGFNRTNADKATYKHFEDDRVLRIFGATGDVGVPNPTRLIVHDCFLSELSVRELEFATTDQPFTETKWEATIDRITSAAVPRQMERVPAGAVFSDCRLVYSVYGTDANRNGNGSLPNDLNWFFDVLQMLQLVEDDYLGSSGSRGSGQVRFERIRLSAQSLNRETPSAWAPKLSLIDRDPASFVNNIGDFLAHADVVGNRLVEVFTNGNWA